MLFRGVKYMSILKWESFLETKIEGFFNVCKIKGLTGEQGVMIPHQNVDELALNDEVVEEYADIEVCEEAPF